MKPSLDIFNKYLNKKNNSDSKQEMPIFLLSCYDDLCKKNKSLAKRKKNVLSLLSKTGYTSNQIHNVDIFWKEDLNMSLMRQKGILQPKAKMFLKPGEIGNLLSHGQALVKFLETNSDYCLVLEDDAYIKKDFKKEMERILKELKTKKIKWDVFWIHNSGAGEWRGNEKSWINLNVLNPITWTSKKPVYTNSKTSIYRIKENFVASTSCYMINRKAAKRMLKEMFPIGVYPTDVFMQKHIPSSEVHLSFPPAKITNNGHFSYLVSANTEWSLIQL